MEFTIQLWGYPHLWKPRYDWFRCSSLPIVSWLIWLIDIIITYYYYIIGNMSAWAYNMAEHDEQKQVGTPSLTH